MIRFITISFSQNYISGTLDNVGAVTIFTKEKIIILQYNIFLLLPPTLEINRRTNTFNTLTIYCIHLSDSHYKNKQVEGLIFLQ